jgi:hypothetical protein
VARLDRHTGDAFAAPQAHAVDQRRTASSRFGVASAITSDDAPCSASGAGSDTKIVGPVFALTRTEWRSVRRTPSSSGFVNGVPARVRKDGRWRDLRALAWPVREVDSHTPNRGLRRMMRAFDPATKLDELHDACERISANLVDLEIDSGRQLLDAGTLEGRSAARWGEATTALTELWREHGLLQELLRVADELRGARHADDLAELLSGRSIGLAIADVPIAERQLPGSSQVEGSAPRISAWSGCRPRLTRSGRRSPRSAGRGTC